MAPFGFLPRLEHYSGNNKTTKFIFCPWKTSRWSCVCSLGVAVVLQSEIAAGRGGRNPTYLNLSPRWDQKISNLKHHSEFLVLLGSPLRKTNTNTMSKFLAPVASMIGDNMYNLLLKSAAAPNMNTRFSSLAMPVVPVHHTR